MYTKEELKIINGSYDNEHGVNEIDVEIVNNLIPIIECSRDITTPKVGDIVQFTNAHGEYYEHAHIENIIGDQVYICERPYTPFVSVATNSREIHTSTSGGAWFYIPKNIRWVGSVKKAFNVWGHLGPCGNGALRFNAEVSVWEYTKGQHQFTTKTHDKFHLWIHQSDDPSEYKYLISKGSHNHVAFHTEEEYKAWVNKFNGVELDGVGIYSKTIWTYKQEIECIPLEKYLAIENAAIDSVLSNGSNCECKRVIEGTTITTYMPYANERILVDVVIE